GCGDNLLNLSGLLAGNTYFIRVFSNLAGSPTAVNSIFEISVSPLMPGNVGSGRMNEVFQQTILSPPNLLADPWEIIYGPDNNLWITEAKGYKVYKMNPTTGVKTTVLDVSFGSTFFAAPDDAFHATFNLGTHNPQGGLAGLVLHPKFLAASGAQNYAYVSYVYSFDSVSAANGQCKFFKNRLVRFTYNAGTDKFESPISLCDTLPGGNDHNSQRVFIAPVDGVDYLFYASGDMGGGQLNCAARLQKAQMLNSYEGKILRFNLLVDSDPGPSLLNKWIPNDNPFNTTLGVQSAVWVTGIRNNQGFAYDTARKILYGSSHGAYSDDEINIIEKGKNYGHPLVQGYASDNNYNGASAGTPKNSPPSSNPIITSEVSNAAAIGITYKDPLFSGYPSGPGYASIYNDIWNATSTPNNAFWPSEGWAGLDLYSNNMIPGWKGSLVATSLKWGRLVRIKLGASGTITVPSNHPIDNAGDTISYFGSQNRFRDLAFAPNGKDIYVIMDRSTSTSGPSALFPVVPTCQGCVQKYTFMGYAHNTGTGKSTIPTSIPVDLGTSNICAPASTININSTNNNIWVPITGPDGNIVAEIKANNQNLGNVTTSFFTKKGLVREDGARRLFLNRNITITPQVQPGSGVDIRLYITKAELDSLKSAKNSAGAGSGVTSINNLSIYKNADACGTPFATATSKVAPAYAEAHGDSGYVLQANIMTFSTFYFANSSFTILPMELIVFKGALQNSTVQLQWKTEHESNTAYFNIERSIDGQNFETIGKAGAKGAASNAYKYVDQNAGKQSSALVYYRLKIVDTDGGTTYSSIISFTLGNATTFNIFPNPVKEVLKVELSLSKGDDVQVQVTDMQGRVVYSRERFLDSGLHQIDIEVKGWPAQTYSVKVTSLKNKISALKNVIKL
ncbi:MAG TPA: PQQ-dependent sugar dehydrogenase, partial [Flavisolibacter sp.]